MMIEVSQSPDLGIVVTKIQEFNQAVAECVHSLIDFFDSSSMIIGTTYNKSDIIPPQE